MPNFDDRFTYDNAELKNYLDNTPPDQIDNAELEDLSPRLKAYANNVRRHNILIQSRETFEIYEIATGSSDSEISLTLSAAQDALGNPLFPGEDSIKNIMYGTDHQGSKNRDLFHDGVRQVSVMLTAATLIGQFAQFPEQLQHSNSLYKRARESLERLLQLPEIKPEPGQSEPETANASFLFRPEEVTLDAQTTLTCEVYIPSLILTTSWVTIQTYTDQTVSTAAILSEIADAVNDFSLNEDQFNLIASPILAGKGGLHHLELYPRAARSGIQSEVVSIRFTLDDGNGQRIEAPFHWGVDANFLATYGLNSTLILVREGTVSTKSPSDAEEAVRSFNVLYIRASNKTPTASQVAFRVSPTDREQQTFSVPTDTDPKDIPNAFATALSQQLTDTQSDTRLLGAVVRNDSPDAKNPVAAVSIVPFSITNPETAIVVDLLSFPESVEVAVGDISNPMTPFSSRPKSLRVETQFKELFPQNREAMPSQPKSVRVVKLKRNALIDRINDEVATLYGYRTGG